MLCSKDFYKQSNYNTETKEQLWCSAVGDIHDTFCSCNYPFAHFLSCIFPLGHSDRNLSINQILKRDYREKCLGGGTAAENHGLADIKEETHADGIPEKENHTPDADIEEDLALAAAAAEGER